jgi:hypothetical protein
MADLHPDETAMFPNDFFLGPAQLALLIPIIAIIMGIGMSMLRIYLDFRRKSEVLRLYHAERMAAIEKGIELPPLPEHFVQPVQPESSAQPWRYAESPAARHRRHGLLLIVIGLSVTWAMWKMWLDPVFWWGLVPAAIGVALLVSSLVEGGPPGGSGPGPQDGRRY